MNHFHLYELLNFYTTHHLLRVNCPSSQRKAQLGWKLLKDIDYIHDEQIKWKVLTDRWVFNSSEGFYTVIALSDGWFWTTDVTEYISGPFVHKATAIQIATRDYLRRRNHTLTYGRKVV